MTTDSMLQLRPRRRQDLRLGPGTLRGTTVTHPVLDPVTGGRYELRPKEFFVLSSLDGTATLGEVGEAYAVRFGVRLGERNWQQLLVLLHGRGLLVADHPNAQRPPAARPVAAAADEAGDPADRPSNLLAGRTRMVADADAFIEGVHRRTGFARSRAFLTALLVVTAAMLADLGLHGGLLAHDLRELAHRPVLVLAVGVVLWVSLGLHEVAHGLVGRAYGGRVTEIGLRWRLPVTYLYCLVRDMAFFSRRGHQVATVLAGPATNLVFLLPFWAGWLLVPRAGPAHYALGGLLLLGVATAAGNLVPLPPLDGYKTLGYLTGTSRLAADSRVFLRLAVAGWFGRGPGTAGYSGRTRWVYGVYGVFNALVTAALAGGLLAGAGLWLAGRYGTATGFLPLIVVVAALALRRLGMAARAKREALAAHRSAA
ncbi:M50 family metallopeptidase [Streptantibioticus silvisoli]|uniref:M50 family metallopeptidase n=1 Tax=Streptantibioticus silvisoli TaxID=2705255 RepID=A0ABT6VWB3_9ACTN|nr:M50 family metallopeptidase [Streptantibioticus silvisoli]MDI5961758.1 M50 family metallopeptidase [Streptantibioticus silvisoli]